jgi:hypothetical protein
MIESAPTFFEFYPELKWQQNLVYDMNEAWDYSKGVHTALCSGTVGSGKSILAAHVGIKHLLDWPKSRCLIARRTLPDLKDTLYKEILEQLEGSELIDGKHYFPNDTKAKIRFANGSEFLGKSWADRKYKKLGSLKLSAAIIEEAAENDDEDEKALEFIKMRLARLPHVHENWLLLLTNPDSPEHFLYKRYIDRPEELSKVYYSDLRDNHFLSSTYREGLARGMDPKLALRMLEGKWVEIYGETVYHQYTKERNYKDISYEPNLRDPIRISWDFNIGEGKPMSLSVSQIVNDQMHIFNEVVIEGMRTEDSCFELEAKGLLEYPNMYIINGDGTGRHRDTRSKMDDWDIIKRWFSNFKQKNGRPIKFRMSVPRQNPQVRKRHNKVNAWCHNALGEVNLFVYKDAPTADQGLRLTKLKDKANYIEDDSKPFQHISTNIGYALIDYLNNKALIPPQMISR